VKLVTKKGWLPSPVFLALIMAALLFVVLCATGSALLADFVNPLLVAVTANLVFGLLMLGLSAVALTVFWVMTTRFLASPVVWTRRMVVRCEPRVSVHVVC
jgi:hypothetical protein